MRRIVRAALPLGQGIVLDPFMGGGSTVAACVAVGYAGIGVELDPAYFEMARSGIPALARLQPAGTQAGGLTGRL
jgi:site-specific DNA-methyltransferase (adenine-specific)